MSNYFLPFHRNGSWSHIEICSSTYGLKFQLLSWQLWVSQDPKVCLRIPLFLSHVHPTSWKGFPPASYLSNGTSCILPGPQLNGFHFPSSPWDYSNEPVILQQEPGSPSWQSLPHWFPPMLSCLGWGVFPPKLWG